MLPPPSRRDFLLGRGVAAAGNPACREGCAEESSYLLRMARPAMACEFEICLNVGQYDNGGEVALDALDLLRPLEEQMSVFRPESEISRINRLAALHAVEVEPRLFALLELAMRLYRETDGAYDITAGPLWEVWGFARRQGTVPSAEALTAARQVVGGHLVELDARGGTVRFLRPGVKLNLGSIGKGHAVDCCAQRLLDGGIGDCLLHGGNSSIRAHGSRGWIPSASVEPRPAGSEGDASAVDGAARAVRGWAVGVRDPLHPDRRLGEVRLRDRALGTSGAQFQSFRHQGKRYGHILDSRSGWPAEGVLSVTVLAPTAALADALSTAFYVMGPSASLEYCRNHPRIAVALFCPIPGGPGWELHVAGDLAADLRASGS